MLGLRCVPNPCDVVSHESRPRPFPASSEDQGGTRRHSLVRPALTPYNCQLHRPIIKQRSTIWCASLGYALSPTPTDPHTLQLFTSRPVVPKRSTKLSAIRHVFGRSLEANRWASSETTKTPITCRHHRHFDRTTSKAITVIADTETFDSFFPQSQFETILLELPSPLCWSPSFCNAIRKVNNFDS